MRTFALAARHENKTRFATDSKGHRQKRQRIGSPSPGHREKREMRQALLAPPASSRFLGVEDPGRRHGTTHRQYGSLRLVPKTPSPPYIALSGAQLVAARRQLKELLDSF